MQVLFLTYFNKIYAVYTHFCGKSTPKTEVVFSTRLWKNPHIFYNDLLDESIFSVQNYDQSQLFAFFNFSVIKTEQTEHAFLKKYVIITEHSSLSLCYNFFMQSSFNTIIKKLCTELKINFIELSSGWVFKLQKDGKTAYIIGNRFDLNLSASGEIASDKSATFSVLNHHLIPVIPHYVAFDNTLPQDLVYPVVLKPNRGSRGRGVTLCKNQNEAKTTATKLLKSFESICYSPYHESPYEYRTFYLDGKVLCIYRKTKPKGSWKHNLSGGATPDLVPKGSLYRQIEELAIKTGQALNIRFATIDILDTIDSGMMVLEVNQGVTTTIFSESVPGGKQIAEDIYRAALLAMFPR